MKILLLLLLLLSFGLRPAQAIVTSVLETKDVKYEVIFKEYFDLVDAHVQNRDVAKIEELSQEFINRHKDLNIAEIYIWNTDLKTKNNLLFQKTYIKAGGALVYPKIRYSDPRRINISEQEQEGQKYILIEQQFLSGGEISYRMVILI